MKTRQASRTLFRLGSSNRTKHRAQTNYAPHTDRRSYFDTLNLQIKALPHLTDNTYLTSSAKPTPFARNLLSSKGLEVPEIFVDADILERFANRRTDRAYELDLNEVKNLIYRISTTTLLTFTSQRAQKRRLETLFAVMASAMKSFSSTLTATTQSSSSRTQTILRSLARTLLISTTQIVLVASFTRVLLLQTPKQLASHMSQERTATFQTQPKSRFSSQESTSSATRSISTLRS